MTGPRFDEVLRFHRKKAGLSQAALAALADVGKTVVFDIEHGKQSVRFTTLSKVLGAVGIRLDWTSPLRESYEAHCAAAGTSETP